MFQSWPDICKVLGVSPSQSVCCGRWLTLHWLVTETRNGCSHLRAVFRFLSRWHRWEDVLWKCRWGWKLNHSVMLVQSGWRSQSLVAFEGQLREVKSSLYVCCSYWMNVTTGVCVICSAMILIVTMHCSWVRRFTHENISFLRHHSDKCISIEVYIREF